MRFPEDVRFELAVGGPLAATRRRLSRRRAITVLGAFAGIPLLVTDHRSADVVPLFEWSGTSLGSPSRLLLYHPSRAEAGQIIARCVTEIERLELIFALHRGNSEIARLNRDRRLTTPSHDMLLVLSQCQHLSALSGGAFDVTVQPLWDLYARHFFGAGSPAHDGPGPRAIAATRRLVDWTAVHATAQEVALARPGMGVTLNGVAQGYVTDRVTGILRESGFDRILADFGHSELYAVGRHPDGRAWRIGLADPRQPDISAVALELADGSLCTSGGYGTKFEATGRYHHLFDPTTGASASHYIATSVFAPSAQVADALSTMLYVTPPERGRRVLANFQGVTALVTLPNGTMQQIAG